MLLRRAFFTMVLLVPALVVTDRVYWFVFPIMIKQAGKIVNTSIKHVKLALKVTEIV